jgi:acetoacetate decarboxylase
MRKESHTPLPWTVRQQNANRWRVETSEEGEIPLTIATVTLACCGVDSDSPETNRANANFIVRCCNSYDELVAVCEEMQGVLTKPGIMDVDQWKAWAREAEEKARTILARVHSRP